MNGQDSNGTAREPTDAEKNRWSAMAHAARMSTASAQAAIRRGKRMAAAAAWPQIRKLISDNIIKALLVGIILDPIEALLWYYSQVKKDGPMDYKNRDRWKEALPGVPYPPGGVNDAMYSVFGYPLSPANLGNMNAGAVGKTLGILEVLILQQAGAAHLRDHEGYGFISSQLESVQRGSDEFYGDSEDCNTYINIGFSLVS